MEQTEEEHDEKHQADEIRKKEKTRCIASPWAQDEFKMKAVWVNSTVFQTYDNNTFDVWKK